MKLSSDKRPSLNIQLSGMEADKLCPREARQNNKDVILTRVGLVRIRYKEGIILLWLDGQ